MLHKTALFLAINILLNSSCSPMTTHTPRSLYSTFRQSKGYPLAHKAEMTCNFSRFFRSCDSYPTCISDNDSKVRFQLDTLHSYLYWLLHDYQTLNIPLLCDSSNLPDVYSIYERVTTQLNQPDQKPQIYVLSTLLADYIYNLADVINYVYYGHTWIQDSSFILQASLSSTAISSLYNLHNLTTLGTCGDTYVVSPMLQIFSPLTPESTFNQRQKFTNTVTSYCVLCEFCHTVKHYYKLVSGESLGKTCSCTSRLSEEDM